MEIIFFGGKNKFGGKISVSNYMFLLDEGNLVILFKGRCIFKIDNTKWYFCKNSEKMIVLQISQFLFTSNIVST